MRTLNYFAEPLTRFSDVLIMPLPSYITRDFATMEPHILPAIDVWPRDMILYLTYDGEGDEPVQGGVPGPGHLALVLTRVPGPGVPDHQGEL